MGRKLSLTHGYISLPSPPRDLPEGLYTHSFQAALELLLLFPQLCLLLLQEGATAITMIQFDQLLKPTTLLDIMLIVKPLLRVQGGPVAIVRKGGM